MAKRILNIVFFCVFLSFIAAACSDISVPPNPDNEAAMENGLGEGESALTEETEDMPSDDDRPVATAVHPGAEPNTDVSSPSTHCNALIGTGCPTDHYCAGPMAGDSPSLDTAGVCKPLRQSGASCASDNSCLTGNCLPIKVCGAAESIDTCGSCNVFSPSCPSGTQCKADAPGSFAGHCVSDTPLDDGATCCNDAQCDSGYCGTSFSLGSGLSRKCTQKKQLCESCHVGSNSITGATPCADGLECVSDTTTSFNPFGSDEGVCILRDAVPAHGECCADVQCDSGSCNDNGTCDDFLNVGEKCTTDKACGPNIICATTSSKLGRRCVEPASKLKNQDCIADEQCVSGLCDIGGSNRCIQCEADNDCQASDLQYCQNGFCEVKLYVGSDCSKDTHCLSGFCGASGVCGCQSNADCVGGYCQAEQCVPYAKTCETCDSSDQCTPNTPAGHGFADPICGAPSYGFQGGETGNVCFHEASREVGDSCCNDSQCSSNWCALKLDGTERINVCGCTDSSDCSGNAFCGANNLCYDKYPAGKSCTKDGQCQSGDCKNLKCRS
jgi:hypothetical protein